MKRNEIILMKRRRIHRVGVPVHVSVVILINKIALNQPTNNQMEWNDFGRGRPSHFDCNVQTAHIFLSTTPLIWCVECIWFCTKFSRYFAWFVFSFGLPYLLFFVFTPPPFSLFLALARSLALTPLSIEIILELQYWESNDGLNTRKNHSNFMPNHKSIYLEFLCLFFFSSAVALKLGISAILRKLKNVVQERIRQRAKQRPKRTQQKIKKRTKNQPKAGINDITHSQIAFQLFFWSAYSDLGVRLLFFLFCFYFYLCDALIPPPRTIRFFILP